jgi:hypothetical protein
LGGVGGSIVLFFLFGGLSLATDIIQFQFFAVFAGFSTVFNGIQRYSTVFNGCPVHQAGPRHMHQYSDLTPTKQRRSFHAALFL